MAHDVQDILGMCRTSMKGHAPGSLGEDFLAIDEGAIGVSESHFGQSPYTKQRSHRPIFLGCK